MQFLILDINGNPPPPALRGWNDVVLVPAGMGNVRFIAKFENHADPIIPYMYHCHMLTHEDDGMMGQFLVVDPSASIDEIEGAGWNVYPVPTNEMITIQSENTQTFSIYNALGQRTRNIDVLTGSSVQLKLDKGVYFIVDSQGRYKKIQIL